MTSLAIDVISIFPDYVKTPLALSLPGKAFHNGLAQLKVHDLRRWATDVHHSVDDTPYGGGPGMVMRADVWGEALDEVCRPESVVVVPSASGRLYTQQTAQELSTSEHLVVMCGRYEGIDQRVIEDRARTHRVLELCIGDYVLIGGEAAALVIIESLLRLVPGVLGNEQSHQQDSFQNQYVEGPTYTRPEIWRGIAVPPVLLSGNHAEIDRWRYNEAIKRTKNMRPDLM